MDELELSKVERVISSWRLSPLKFVVECIGAEPTVQQREALLGLGRLVSAKVKVYEGVKVTKEERELAKKIGISIMSGHLTGKDAFASWAILWFLCCYPRPVIPCTAPTADQLQKVLWSEVYKWLNRRDEKGGYICCAREWVEIQNDKIFLKERGGKDWFAVARTSNAKSSADEQAETLAGFNEDYKMVVVDEASGVPDGVFNPLEGGLGGKCNFILMIFNPTRSKGFSIRSQYEDRERWLTYRWNSEECERINRDHFEMMADKYGKDSNKYRIRVLGLPPLADDDALIPRSWIEDALDKDFENKESAAVLGVDVGCGGDKSVVVVRRGGKVERLFTSQTKDTMELVGWVSMIMDEEEAAAVFVDNIGIGQGVFDRLKENGRNVFAVDARRTPKDPEKFCKMRDELWWTLREMFEQRLISIPRNEELMEQLQDIKYGVDSSGKIKIEGKKQMKAQGRHSPDEADALCLTYFLNDSIFRKGVKKKDMWTRTNYSNHEGAWMN